MSPFPGPQHGFPFDCGTSFQSCWDSTSARWVYMFRRYLFWRASGWFQCFPQSFSGGAIHGRGAFPAIDKPFKCLPITFDPPFSADNVHVQIALYNADSRGFTYEAGVGWTENVTRVGFTACAVTSGPNRNLQTLKLDWMAFLDAPKGSSGSGRYTIPFFTSGTRCQDIYFRRVRNRFIC